MNYSNFLVHHDLLGLIGLICLIGLIGLIGLNRLPLQALEYNYILSHDTEWLGRLDFLVQ